MLFPQEMLLLTRKKVVAHPLKVVAHPFLLIKMSNFVAEMKCVWFADRGLLDPLKALQV